MLTLFALPKPFRGHDGVIQRNALGSWVRLRPACEILLFGDDEGVAAAAAEFGVRHIPGVACNEHGTPLLDAAFALAARHAAHGTLCYVNADIMLLPDFLPAVPRIGLRRYLMAGQRWDLDLPGPFDFGPPDWEERLRREIRERGALHSPSGSDYFVFPRGAIGTLPPFAVGRPGWDNWMIYHARASGIPVVDASSSVTAVHQNHGYGHVKGARGGSWDGPEGDTNLALAGGWDGIYILDDATHVLTPRGLGRATGDRYLRQRLDRRSYRASGERGRLRLLNLLYAGRRLPPEALWRRVIYALS